MTDAEALDRATKAKAIIESPLYLGAFSLVREKLIAGIEACPTADVAAAEDFRRCLRLLRAVHSNLDAAISSGKIAQFNVEQIEAKRKNPFRGIFR